jgi:DNA-binding MarR family transcriptional regulator
MKTPSVSYVALSFLAATGPLTARALGGLLQAQGRTSSLEAITTSCLGLEKAGYIESQPGNDSQSTLYKITEHGQAHMVPALRRFFRPSMRALGTTTFPAARA